MFKMFNIKMFNSLTRRNSSRVTQDICPVLVRQHLNHVSGVPKSCKKQIAKWSKMSQINKTKFAKQQNRLKLSQVCQK